MEFSFIKDDVGYRVYNENLTIDRKIPYKEDIQPRLVRFLRALYYFKKYKMMPCTPLDMEYSINNCDWIAINRYIRKYNIQMD